jgi:DNA-binding NtrC family response regulator
MVLAETFLEEIGRSVGRPAAGLSKDARDRLLAHRWPGNVRELRNALERAVILCEGGLITGEHLPFAVAGGTMAGASAAGAATGAASVSGSRTSATALDEAASAGPGAAAIPPEGLSLDEVERDLIQRAMAQAGNNKSEAARLLGLARGQLYSKLRRHGLTRAKR